jgi:hypothetical protein
MIIHIPHKKKIIKKGYCTQFFFLEKENKDLLSIKEIQKPDSSMTT